jgi:hypothetical protein
MGFLPKKWLRSLWGVEQPRAQFDPPIDCDDCRRLRAAGKDACAVHGVHHPRPHVYSMGHELGWGSGLDSYGTSARRNESLPARDPSRFSVS